MVPECLSVPELESVSLPALVTPSPSTCLSLGQCSPGFPGRAFEGLLSIWAAVMWLPGNLVLQQAPARTGFVDAEFKDLPKPRALSLFKALPNGLCSGVCTVLVQLNSCNTEILSCWVWLGTTGRKGKKAGYPSERRKMCELSPLPSSVFPCRQTSEHPMPHRHLWF